MTDSNMNNRKYLKIIGHIQNVNEPDFVVELVSNKSYVSDLDIQGEVVSSFEDKTERGIDCSGDDNFDEFEFVDTAVGGREISGLLKAMNKFLQLMSAACDKAELKSLQ